MTSDAMSKNKILAYRSYTLKNDLQKEERMGKIFFSPKIRVRSGTRLLGGIEYVVSDTKRGRYNYIKPQT